ncbi:phosphoadenosine phosphosulfate reductase family protein [Pseudomonas aeruginosa]|uniref:phosphoadenosine phosphosulfate reductase domain-containing protein n=1 Tax=Pseudomonas aeruginosa TaxID=287 RepID=UPI0021AE4047|nr:phosphoadenosine phosphosulfate reductase family protein [Pseudomonas aeruginosa]MDU0703950.1 phosphoadenosine phosphosulfate reductase family protein [Pseudomonas aeruginosa]
MTAFRELTLAQARPFPWYTASTVHGQQHNIVSVSGGKDSTATLLVAMAHQVPNLRGVFADTGNEHELTLEYIDYLEQVTGVAIERRRADFSRQIAGKRRYIETKWRDQGVAETIIEAALDVLQPTGIPFLDLCLWKGRFPSRKAQFCTEELKRNVQSPAFTLRGDIGPDELLEGKRRAIDLAMQQGGDTNGN